MSRWRGPDMQFIPGGDQILFCRQGKSGSGLEIAIWDIKARQERQCLEFPDRDWKVKIALSPDGKHLAMSDGTILDLAGGKPQHKFAVAFGVPAFSPDNKQVVYGGLDGRVRLWDVATGQELQPLTGVLGPLNTVSFSSDDTSLLSAGLDNKARVWNPSTGAAQERGSASQAWYIPAGATGGDQQALLIVPNG